MAFDLPASEGGASLMVIAPKRSLLSVYISQLRSQEQLVSDCSSEIDAMASGLPASEEGGAKSCGRPDGTPTVIGHLGYRRCDLSNFSLENILQGLNRESQFTTAAKLNTNQRPHLFPQLVFFLP